ncbi:hypothetical protein DTL42_07635 [Bremerella cremea]|uniref:Uncharacterized protein n=1 Tax=Bremerella cremea TaxID=1031537 RepID=A0A368KSQ7_9BACT|nr:hypothetical protein [Bremerella cremea]RCS52700.1 hypothetical protein DTL42_07635 [Bremerella cremea]
MFDFLFRRGNPTNDWQRSSHLKLTASLDIPEFNGIPLGAPFERVSFLGRDDAFEFGAHCYHDLGVSVERSSDNKISGFWIVYVGEDYDKFQTYQGELTWQGEPLDVNKLNQDNLSDVLGPRYWLDTDEDESIAFYEFPTYEIQVELTLSGKIKRFGICQEPLLADPQHREALGVTKPWIYDR